MSKNVNKTVLITGASSGIGEAFAQVFSEQGFDLVLTARRQDRLESIASNLKLIRPTNIHIIQADLSDPMAPKNILDFCTKNKIHIDCLVNNAGYGNPGKFEETPWQSHQDFLQVMVTAVTELTYLFLPGMIKKQYGRIINLASLAPYMPAPDMAGLYSPVKIFQIKFSESIHFQYCDHNIHCSAVCPGLTRTEFHETANMHEVLNSPNWLWMDSITVARQGVDAVMKGKCLIINGRLNNFFAILFKLIPQNLTSSIAKYLTKRSY